MRDATEAANMALAFPPFQALELTPLEELCRGLKQTVAAHLCSPSLDELAACVVAWLTVITRPAL